MNSNNESFQETCNLFTSESLKLEYNIKNILEKSEKLSIHEIVDVYYQIINVTSLIKFLKQGLSGIENSKLSEEQNTLYAKIQETENLVSDKFDANLHPLVMSQLTNSITDYMENLKSVKKVSREKKSKDDIEEEAKLYDKLREIMSTKEFVVQYDKGLEHD